MNYFTVNKQKITPLAESEQNMEWGRNTVAVNLRILNFDFLWLYSIEEDSKCIVLCHWQTVTVLLLFQFGLCFSFLGLPKPCWIKMVIMDLLALFLILDGCYQLSTIGNDVRYEFVIYGLYYVEVSSHLPQKR